MEKKQVERLIKKTLKGIGLYSKEALLLLMGTMAQESAFGRYIRQLNGGPALGVFQCEPGTFNYDLEKLKAKPHLYTKVLKVSGCREMTFEQLETNLALAICFARLHYYFYPKAIPRTLEEQYNYYKVYYNSVQGAATKDQYLTNYKKYIGEFKID
ncbi:hypothetical protein MHBO_003946 [Bonamia ostreae]|uniref:Uncharacterized protein n=1 Tax=Bonamia ostreae TaxID=126728 RepID=A0ABV2ASR1_9EUKA